MNIEPSGNQRSKQMMILCRDVCTRRYLMSAEHEFSIRCEGQISGNGPGIEPSLWRKRDWQRGYRPAIQGTVQEPPPSMIDNFPEME